MSEQSEFQVAFDDFQKGITSSLLDMAGCSDFFRKLTSFPLPYPQDPTINADSKPSAKKTSTSSKEKKEVEEEKSEEKKEGEKKNEKKVKEQKKEKNEKNENQEQKEYTQEEIDQEIIACSKRTQSDLLSDNFIKSVKKRIKIPRPDIIKRINELKDNGTIVQK